MTIKRQSFWLAAFVSTLCAGLLLATGAKSTEATNRCDDLGPTITQAAEDLEAGHKTAGVAALHEVLETAQTRGCLIQEARTRSILGWHYTRVGRLARSLPHLDLGLQAIHKFTAHGKGEATSKGNQEAKLQHNFGAALVRLGRPDLAIDRLHRAQLLYGQFGSSPEDIVGMLLQFARAYRLLGESADAEASIDEALLIAPNDTDRATLKMEQVRLLMDTGQLDEAAALLDDALKSANKTGNVRLRANLFADRAELEIRRNNWSRALGEANLGLELAAANELSDPNMKAHAYYAKSVALFALGHFADARVAADAGLSVLEDPRDPWSALELHYIDLRQDYYQHRLDIAAASNDAKDAWATLQRIQARTLATELGKPTMGLTNTRGPSKEELIAHGKELIDAVLQLDLVEPGAEQAVKTHRHAVLRTRLLKKLQIEQLATAGVDTQQSPMTLAEAQALLDNKTLALLFAAGNQALHLVTLDDRGQLELSTLPADLQQIEAKASEVAAALKADQKSDVLQLDAEIRWLSEALLHPLTGRLESVERLVIVADAPLTRLPYGLLTHPRTGKFLIESHEISYVPSLSVLSLLRDRAMMCPQPTKQILAVGDPFFGQRDKEWPEDAPYRRNDDEALMFQRLEGSGQEVLNIAQLYPDDSATILLRKDATRQRLLSEASKHRTLHIASHALSNLEIAERSKIALSCMGIKGPVDGPCDLYPEQLAFAELCGQLVVLSACSTAEGPLVFGEGTLGLPRAFLRAGASTVIASQWAVTDQPTAKLMTAFHRYLQTGESSASALRQAKRDMIQEGATPSEWAAFVLLGDGETSNTFNLPAKSGSHESTDGSQDPQQFKETDHGDRPGARPQTRR